MHFAAVHESGIGPTRHFDAADWSNPFRRPADIGSSAGLRGPVAIDPKLPSYRSLNLSGNVLRALMGCMDDPAEDAKWRVSLLNDDITPMEFVVYVVEQVFNLDRETATHLMLHVHYAGIGECGVHLQMQRQIR